MAEPTTTAAAAGAMIAAPLIVIAGRKLGVDLGTYVIVFLGATCGAFWALVSSPLMTRWQSAGLALRSILLSVLVTASIARLLSDTFGWDVQELYVIVSIAVAGLGDKWLEIFNSLKEALMTGMGNVFKRKEDTK